MHGENGVCSVFKGLWRQSCSLQSSRICLCIFCCGAAGVAALWCSKSTSQVNPILWKSESLLCLGKTRGLSNKTPNKHEILLLIFILRIKDQKPGILEKKKMYAVCLCPENNLCGWCGEAQEETQQLWLGSVCGTLLPTHDTHEQHCGLKFWAQVKFPVLLRVPSAFF